MLQTFLKYLEQKKTKLVNKKIKRNFETIPD